MENNRKDLEEVKGQVQVSDLTLDPEPKIRLKQLEAIQEYLLAEGRNNENINSAILEIREWL